MATRSVAFAFVLLLLQSFVVSMSMAAILNIATDQSSLLALKRHITHDPNNILAKNWSSNGPVCSWIGVTCSFSHLRVTALNLTSMSLVGTIPPHVGNLSFISYLNLRSNSFQGSLPREMAQLRRMKILSLGDNNFTGEIPSWFVFLPKLEWLDLEYNSFTGDIPSSLFNITSLQILGIGSNNLWGFLPSNFFMAHSLQFLSIDDNEISGSIPSSILKNSSLQTIDLTYNYLSGVLPENIFNQLPQLEVLALSNNQFSGKLPLSLFSCKQLIAMSLSYNNFTGTLPQEIGNLTMLEDIYLGLNNFSPGTIPHEIGNLKNLYVLALQKCNLRGTIPSVIFNVSTITDISLVENFFVGSLPHDLGFTLPNLENLHLWDNYLSGKIPNFLSNATMLNILDLSTNLFYGHIPNIFDNLRTLELLDFDENNLTSESTAELSFVNSLSNCISLKTMDFSLNPLNAKFPNAIGNLSNSLEKFYLQTCNLWGSIPTSIGNLSGLISLYLDENQLTGVIPREIGKLVKLQGLGLHKNKLEGSIPHELCQLRSLGFLELQSNRFFGSINTCLGNLTSLREISLAYNNFNSTIPSTLWGLSYLLKLDLSSNELRGALSLDIGNLKVLIELYLSRNLLSGNIPSTFGQLQDLISLTLAQNKFEGSIAESFGSMLSLEHLDLSENNLSGVIPNSMKALVHLNFFNVSFNKLQGKIPNGIPFTNFTTQSFLGNDELCGGPQNLRFPKCKSIATSKHSKTTSIALKCLFPIVMALVLLLTLIYVLIRRQRQRKQSISNVDTTVATWQRISYHELHHATNGFNDINLLGSGSFGKAYKGILSNGMSIVVKVFNLELEGAFKSFDVECEILCNVRHRNLVKVISSCANIDFKALILSYMPNGSLEMWLHSNNHCLSIIQGLNIMIDVATALDYLHHGVSPPVVHCDLKPSNILLDEEMVGHVTDFGVGKLMGGGNSITQTMTLATIGYMAPEYGLEGFVSRQGDVYSYGILLMETFTLKKPTNEMFQGGFNMRNWIKESYPDAIVDIVDAKLLIEDGVPFARKKDCLISIMRLALDCCVEISRERKNIKDVLVTLQKIKKRLINEAGPQSSI